MLNDKKAPALPLKSKTGGDDGTTDYVSRKGQRQPTLADALVAARPELAELYCRDDLQALADEFVARLLWAGGLSGRMRE